MNSDIVKIESPAEMRAIIDVFDISDNLHLIGIEDEFAYPTAFRIVDGVIMDFELYTDATRSCEEAIMLQNVE